jgi:MvdD pre-ATP grasp domain
MILILSDPEHDAHVGFVTEELQRRGLDYITFDPRRYPTECDITVETTAQGTSRGLLRCDGIEIDLARVSGAWYRRPGKPAVSEHMDAAEAEWTKEECLHSLRGLYEFVPFERWVSHPTNIQRASLKIWQLRVAHDLGFEIPSYLLTSDPDRALEFLVAHDYNVVAKSLATPFVFYPDRGEVVVMYTQRLSEVTETDLACIGNCPTFLQQYVEKTADVRVTVVGHDAFAVEIDASSSREATVDFRVADAFDLSHRAVRLPSELESACVSLAQKLGLAFGAVDLIRDAEGTHHFLEINPNGQWMWLEWATGLPIRDSVCDRLALRQS